MRLDDFLEEEKSGVIFCKIGKSSQEIWGKGGYFPYKDYIGKTIKLSDGAITFERLDDVVKYLHYGDDLVVFSFIEGENELPKDGYFDNKLNYGCYDTKCIYVKDVLPFCDANTIDYIYEHSKDKTNFIEYRCLATSYLKDRELFEAAQRWEELVVDEETLDNKITNKDERKETSLRNGIMNWFKRVIRY